MIELSKERIDRELAARRADAQKEKRSALDERAVRWLALLPEWTEALALACDFPAGVGGIPDTLERARAVGLCEVRYERSIAERERIRFWMPADERAALFEEWRALGVNPGSDVVEIAGGVLNAPRGVLDETPTGVLRWAELALAELSTRVATGEDLNRRVGDALRDGNPGVAGEWIKAGEWLGRLLGGEMERAAARARWKLNRYYRAVQDAGYLDRFVPRREQMDEVRRLLGPDPEWAVHFIGLGGVGKTMLMRYLTSCATLGGAEPGPSTDGAEPGLKIGASARIDFDYIDPRFPLERPAQLLARLAEDLAGGIDNAEREAAYLAFVEAMAGFEAIGSDASREPLVMLGSDRFRVVTKAFAGFLETLPSPVLLILDTCEELAKLHPPGEDVPSVEAMFAILEQVHEAVPGVRVVLAGRRWLTSQAAEEGRDDAAPAGVKSLKERTFMRMHPVRGFTREETERYLLRARGLDIDRAMIEAVLENTRDPGLPASMGDPEDAAADDRYSPSEVSLYAGWIEADPDLRPADLAGGNFDVYVEVRIFRRIEAPEVRAAIPAAALLGRFDWAMIAPALGDDAGAARRALEGLIDQEWTHLEGGPGREEIVISIDRGLLPRLLDYFTRTRERKEQMDEARKRLAPGLRQLFELPVDDVGPDRIDAAVNVLAPEETAGLLDRLADRVAREGGWAWAESLCRLLLAPEREPRLPEELHASVAALYLGALAHRGSSAERRTLQEMLVHSSIRHPGRMMGRALETRGRLSMLVAAAENGGFAVDGARAALTRGRILLATPATARAVAPALLAASEALIDANESHCRPIPLDNVAVCLDALHNVFAGEETVRAHLLALSGRMWALHGNREAARNAFGRLARMPLESEARPGFVDWVAPESPRHRVLLELLRFRLAEGSETGELLTRCDSAAREADGGLDSARLLSLTLQAWLARGELTYRCVKRAELYEDPSGEYVTSAPAQRATPPLFVSVAEGWLALRRPERALDLLQAREEIVTSSRIDEDGARAATLATVRVLRRQRLAERFGLISSLSLSGDERIRSAAMAAGALIAGLRPPRGSTSAADHAAWGARILLDPRADGEAIEAIRKAELSADDDREALEMALDRLEAAQIWRRWTRRGRWRASRLAEEVGRMAESRGGEPSIREPLGESWLRPLLRWGALVEEPARVLGQVPALRQHQLGWLALEEGELLALHLPERAGSLLGWAERLLADSGDPAGAFFASLRGAITAVHAGLAGEAREMAAGVTSRYEALREIESHLPPPARLRDLGYELGPPGGDPWAGWLHRLAVYLRWCGEASTPEPLDPMALAEAPETTLVPAVGAEGKVSTSISQVGRITKAAAVAAAAIVAFGLIFLLLGGSLRVLLTGLVGGVGGALVGGVLGGALAALFNAVSSRTSRARLRVDAFELSLVLSDRRAESSPWIDAHLEPWARRFLVRNVLRLLRLFSPGSWWTASFPLDDQFLERGPPSELDPALAPRAGGHFVPVRLAVTARLAPVAWERWLVGGMARQQGLSPAELPEVWRVRSRGIHALPAATWPFHVSTVCSPLWRPFVEASAANGVPLTWVDRPGAKPARATFIVGLPAYTRAGWRLRLNEELPFERPELEGEARSQDLISPDSLAREAPIVIVIGRPGGELATEGWLVDGLRAFANETFLAGARAVLSIPPLPAERVSEAIAVLTAEVSSWSLPPDSEQLRELATHLRMTFYRGLVEGDEEQRRARLDQALDVCLFAPP